MLCERSYDPLSRMLLKGDEGGCKIRRGVAENGDFRQGGHYPWMILALRVTGIVPLPLIDPSTQRFMPTFHQSSTYRPGGNAQQPVV
jgi:hypothetical protein